MFRYIRVFTSFKERTQCPSQRVASFCDIFIKIEILCILLTTQPDSLEQEAANFFCKGPHD